MDGLYYFKDGRVEGVVLDKAPLGDAEYRRWGRKEKKYFETGDVETGWTDKPLPYEELPQLVKKIFEADTREGVQTAIREGKLSELREIKKSESLSALLASWL